MERPPPEITASRSIGERLADLLDAERGGGGSTPLEVARARAFEALFGESPQTRNLGRYVVLERIGAGAMGVVYAAYDPELDRKVALKLLRGGVHGGSAIAGQRLIREAQALAKLSHPNVVGVHDAGTFDGPTAEQLGMWAPQESTGSATPQPASPPTTDSPTVTFIAMEFVDGETLRRWLEQAPRSWREVLVMLVQAGRGLVAAHAAGLVHRDFKPDNVMVGRDGRARVMDFGLVRPIDPDSVDLVDDSRTRPDLDALAVPMTRAGAAVGTPLYMAPEQLRGEAVDAKSDQFAYCVTAWESLFGARPYEGRTLLELAANVVAGRRVRPAKARLPKWLRTILQRGLDPNPTRRWPTMEALLTAVTRARRRERVRRWIAVGLTALAIAGGVLGWRAVERSRALAACAEQGASITEAWNDQAREQLREGLMATGAGHAATTFEKAAAAFDEGAAVWQTAREEACVRTDVDRTWDAEIGAKSIDCLEGQRVGYARLLERINASEAVASVLGPKFAARIRASGRCLDPKALAMRTPLPESESLRRQVVALDHAKADVHAAEFVGDYVGALALAKRLLEDAETLGYLPLVTDFRIIAASDAALSGALDDAEALATQGYFEAAVTGRDVAAVDAALTLVAVGRQRSRIDEALEWGRHTDVLLQRQGSELSAEASGELAVQRGHLELARGDPDRAEREFERGLELWTSVYGKASASLVSPLMGLVLVEQARGDSDASVDAIERALAVQEAAMGRDHPQVAETLYYAGYYLIIGGRAEEAPPVLERALEIRLYAVSRAEDSIANLRIMLARAYNARQELDEAERHLLPVLEIVPVGPETLSTRGIALGQLAYLRCKQGRPAEARVAAQEALQIVERLSGPESIDAAFTHGALGRALYEGGEFDQGIEHLERARIIYGANHLAPSVAHAGFLLANALWRDDGDPSRAHAILESAASSFADAEDWESLAEAQQWLATHEVRR